MDFTTNSADKCLILIQQSAIHVANKIAFNPRLGYRTDCNGDTYWEAVLHLDLEEAAGQLVNHQYKFGKFLLINRKTTPTKRRDIYISTWRDKIVDHFLYRLLTNRFDKFYDNSVYAYRSRYGVDYCQSKLQQSIVNRTHYAKRDIRNYFYSIDHDMLLARLCNYIESDDYLLKLVADRLRNQWVDESDNTSSITIGVPFGSSVACALANIYLDRLDHNISSMPVDYFRYADDILILANSSEVIDTAIEEMNREVALLKLSYKESYSLNGELADKVKYLGLLYQQDGTVRLPIEKQRKIVRLVDSALRVNRNKISNLKGKDKTQKVVSAINEALTVRCRGVAIVDYYLKHINDEQQLMAIDRIIKERAVCAIRGRWPFKKGYLKNISFKSLRDEQLVCLLHRSRLLRHSQIRRPFMSLLNEHFLQRHERKLHNRRENLELAALRRRNRKHCKNSAKANT